MVYVLSSDSLAKKNALNSCIAANPTVNPLMVENLILGFLLFQYILVGTVNIHPSLLPLYRGAAPVQRALEVNFLRIDFYSFSA